jgi:hypothetical protein
VAAQGKKYQTTIKHDPQKNRFHNGKVTRLGRLRLEVKRRLLLDNAEIVRPVGREHRKPWELAVRPVIQHGAAPAGDRALAKPFKVVVADAHVACVAARRNGRVVADAM